MTAQKVARLMRLKEWAKQIEECEKSGTTVQQWCEENKIGYKNYFYRKRRVREELLDAMESGTSLSLSNNRLIGQESGVFAEVPSTLRPTRYGTAAVTVQIGAYSAEINNGADIETVEGVLRTLSNL